MRRGLSRVRRHGDDLRSSGSSAKALAGTGTFGPGFKTPTEDPPTAEDIAPLRRRIDLRANALELCYRRDLGDNHEVLAGYILSYPVDEATTSAILTGQITTAEQISDGQVATTFASEDSYYISMVLGADLAARA